VPTKLADELEGQEEEVKPDGAEKEISKGKGERRELLTV
jgi:hypothetical protein